MIEERILTQEEKSIFALRSLYRQYGYLPFRMSKFEEYELYALNKEFLVSDRVITFNDTNGRLMALKPDVTLSIIKSGEDIPGVKQKVCYDERVYRVSNGTRRFKEILQTGLECIGNIRMYDIFEVIFLAAESLAKISDSFVLSVSHLGLLSTILEKSCPDADFAKEAIRAISEKNADELRKLCERFSVQPQYRELILALLASDGGRDEILNLLEPYRELPGASELFELSLLLSTLPYKKNIIYDFSVVSDTNYYSGFVFKGFLKGVCESVLAGGQYNRMMKKMNRSSGAIGFALYLDLLEQLPDEKEDTDVDVLLLCNIETPAKTIMEVVAKYHLAGESVTVQQEIPASLRFRKIVDIRNVGGEGKC